ncbi:class I SAM-dependent methyltransferase [Acidobacteriota bacterium]
MNKNELDELFKSGSADIWSYNFQERKDWQIAANWLLKNKISGRILDIGCWDGEFLSALPTTISPYGIEINLLAAKKALSKKINIIKDNISALDEIPIKFDMVTAFDIIEHVENPYNFIASLCRIAKDNSYIIVASGDTEATSWKISKSRYWYCANPEHMSFINIAWCEYVANKLNLQIVHTEIYSHTKKRTMPKYILEIIKNMTYLISPHLFGNLRNLKRQSHHQKNLGQLRNYPPSWMTSRDHLIIIFKKVDK